MSVTAQAEAQQTRADMDAGPYAHGPRMWRLYDALATCVGNEDWWSAERVCVELTQVVTDHGWHKSHPFTVGAMTIERVPVKVREALEAYNAAVRTAKDRKRAPK